MPAAQEGTEIEGNPLVAPGMEAIAAKSSESQADTGNSNYANQELDDLSSPFTRETVLVLNAIVSRSLSAIEAFDKARREPDCSDRLDNRATRLAKYEDLSEQAHQARIDLVAAGKRLRESGEYYNEAIFAGMLDFVKSVDVEIRQEINKLQDVQTPNDTVGAPAG